MPIKIHMLTLGALQTNCFIVADTATKDAIIIDPSDEAPRILQDIEEHEYTVQYILATHGHFDHVLAAQPVKEATGAPFLIHELDIPMLERSQETAKGYGLPAPDPATHDNTISVGDVFEAGSIKLETLFTPGHAPGHVSFVLASNDVVLSGDCLFAGGIGRTDLPGGDYQTLMTSITQKLLPLGDNYTVCPGHGPTTTIGQERATNGYVVQWLRKQGE